VNNISWNNLKFSDTISGKKTWRVKSGFYKAKAVNYPSAKEAKYQKPKAVNYPSAKEAKYQKPKAVNYPSAKTL